METKGRYKTMSILETRAIQFGRDGSPSRPPEAMPEAAVSAKPPYQSPQSEAMLGRDGLPSRPPEALQSATHRYPSLKAAFTLVEMLVVIGIISVLLGLLYGPLERARKASRYTITYSELKQIQAAFEQYYSYYHTWPTNTSAAVKVFCSEDGGGQDIGFIIDRKIADALQGARLKTPPNRNNEDVFNSMNPDGIPFIEFSRFTDDKERNDPVNPFRTEKTDAMSRREDPRCYVVVFDTTGNRQINVPEDSLASGAPSTNIVANVAVWTLVPGFRRTTGTQSAPESAPEIRLGSWDSFNLQR